VFLILQPCTAPGRPHGLARQDSATSLDRTWKYCCWFVKKNSGFGLSVGFRVSAGFGFGHEFAPELEFGSGSSFKFGFQFWVPSHSTRTEPDPLPSLGGNHTWDERSLNRLRCKAQKTHAWAIACTSIKNVSPACSVWIQSITLSNIWLITNQHILTCRIASYPRIMDQ